MGTLRILLSLAVVVAHVGGESILGFPFFGPTAYQAVSCFFIISGFYMALVLRTKYHTNTKAFYQARMLRLFPIYAFSVFTFFVLQSIAATLGKPMGVWSVLEKSSFSLLEYLMAILANFTGLGSDSIFLWSKITENYLDGLLVLPVVWSLGIEITFYLLAPFILLRSGMFILCLSLLALGMRFAVSWLNEFNWTVWNYYFFPTNLCFFLSGSLAWLATEKIQIIQSRIAGWFAWVILLICVIFGDKIFDWHSIVILYGAFVALIGPVFCLTKNWAWDRAIGELSYPIYLVHWGLLSVYSPLRHFIPEGLKPYFVVCVSIVLSLVLLLAERRFAKWWLKHSSEP